MPIFLIVGCGGKEAQKVPPARPSDRYLYCDEIKNLIEINHQKMQPLYAGSQKGWKNTLLLISGYLTIVPWFFLDFSDSELIEYKSLKRRNAHLYKLARRKGCHHMPAKLNLDKKDKKDKKDKTTQTNQSNSKQPVEWVHAHG